MTICWWPVVSIPVWRRDRMTTSSPIIAHGRLKPVSWQALERFARNLSEFCKVHVSPDRVVTVRLEPGEISLRLQGHEAAIRMLAATGPGLQNLRDTLAHMLDGAEEGLAAGLRWTGEERLEGSLPPNFRVARIHNKIQLSPRFLRLRLEAGDIGFLATGGLHIRLLQPKEAENPAWPRLAANGRTIWPEARDLHKPVYTIREIRPDEGVLDVDVYLHGNGPTCTWASSARIGDVVGLSGPGGGEMPVGENLLLGGDETALPVIARILSSARPDMRGHAVIEVGNPEDILDIPHPDGFMLEWLVRKDSQSIRDVFTEVAGLAMQRVDGLNVLFGGERTDAQAVRHALAIRTGSGAKSLSLSAYWSKQSS